MPDPNPYRSPRAEGDETEDRKARVPPAEDGASPLFRGVLFVSHTFCVWIFVFGVLGTLTLGQRPPFNQQPTHQPIHGLVFADCMLTPFALGWLFFAFLCRRVWARWQLIAACVPAIMMGVLIVWYMLVVKVFRSEEFGPKGTAVQESRTISLHRDPRHSVFPGGGCANFGRDRTTEPRPAP